MEQQNEEDERIQENLDRFYKHIEHNPIADLWMRYGAVGCVVYVFGVMTIIMLGVWLIKEIFQ